jgi:hypothetical protein
MSPTRPPRSYFGGGCRRLHIRASRQFDVELAPTPVDSRVPTLAGLATGAHHIFIEPERNRGCRLSGQGRLAGQVSIILL